MAKDKYVNRVLDERYHLKQLLDSGSFGAVYKALDVKLGRTVAVKILFEQDETAFRKEAQLAVQFEHPNVVKVFDYGSDAELDVGYIAMEFLNGLRLDQVIAQERGRVPLKMVAQFIDEIGSALQSAHDRELIHRDLKTRNVMLVQDGADLQRFVLLDLGLASQTNATSTLRNETLDGALSPQYASPEQFGQGKVDYRSDIYSFATLLFELVAGEIPFLREHLPAMMLAITTEPPPRMNDVALDREIPEELEELVRKCLEKHPEDRPPCIGDVRKQALAALRIDSGTAPPETLSAAPAGTQRPAAMGSGWKAPVDGTLRPPGTAAGETADGTAASTSTSPSPAWRDSSARRTATGRRPDWKTSSKSSYGIAAVLVLLPVVAFVIWKVLPPGEENGRENGGGTVAAGTFVLPEELSVKADGAAFLQTYLKIPEGHEDDTVQVLVDDCPAWLTVTVPDEIPSGQLFDISVKANEDAETATGDLTLTAVVGDWRSSVTVSVLLEAPEIWPLPPGFRAAAGTSTIKSDDARRFYGRIERTLRDDFAVPFVLILPRTESTRGRILRPYYMMENKVWNALFDEFWQQLPQESRSSPARQSWQLGAMAGGADLPAAEHPELPTMRISPKLAHEFAVWLTNGRGHLPTFDQWNLATGLSEWQSGDKDLRGDYALGPFRTPPAGADPDVAVNLRSNGPRPVGSSADDITITGLRDMSGNGLEITDSILQQPSLHLGDLAVRSTTTDRLRIHLRGRSYLSRQPLTWEEISQTADSPDTIGYAEVDPVVGFRVVLETTDQ